MNHQPKHDNAKSVPPGSRILLLDQGNTHLKYLILNARDDGEQIAQMTPIKTEMEHLIDTVGNTQIDYVVLASVSQPAALAKLQIQLADRSIPMLQATTTDSACGVTCAYQKPADMGVDRWLAVIAAHHWANGLKITSPVAILDIGSAITIDLVEPGRHLGGQIAPGKRLLEQALHLTAQVNFGPVAEKLPGKIGQSTSECVALGIENMLEAYVDTQIAELSKAHKVKHWLITGGGAEKWRSSSPNNELRHYYRPGLVLAGLKIWWETERLKHSGI